MSKSIAKYERFDKDGFELVINTKTGESFATVRGYARMAGLDHSTIVKRLSRSKVSKGGDKNKQKRAETLILPGFECGDTGEPKSVKKAKKGTVEIITAQGLQNVRLIDEKTISEWIIRDNPELALKMMQAGVRVFMHSTAGYKVSSKTQPTQCSKLRQEGKKARLSLTDVVKQWIENHPQMSANERKFIYINVSDALNVGLFGKKASKLREIIGCSRNDLRDHFSDAEIVAIHTLEDLAARLVMFEGLHPVRAVVKALETSHYRLGFYSSYKELAPSE